MRVLQYDGISMMMQETELEVRTFIFKNYLIVKWLLDTN